MSYTERDSEVCAACPHIYAAHFPGEPGDGAGCCSKECNCPGFTSPDPHRTRISSVFKQERGEMRHFCRVACQCGKYWTGIPNRGLALYVSKYHRMSPEAEVVPWPPANILHGIKLTRNPVADAPTRRRNWTKSLHRSSGKTETT